MVRTVAGVLALLLGCATASADFVAERFGQPAYPSSMLLQPSLSLYGRDETPLMFTGPVEESRFGMSMGYSESNTRNAGEGEGHRFSATAYGEYLFSQRVGVTGKLGIRQMVVGEAATLPLLDSVGRGERLDYRLGVGVKIDPSEVLSLHFEWERYAQGSESTLPLTPSTPEWDPWQQRNVFGAGVRFGF